MGIRQIAFEGEGSEIVVVGDRIGCDGANQDEMVLGTAEHDVQALLATAAVDRSEIHQHAASAVVAVADAEDDDVALVSLDVFQVLHEQANVLTIVFPLAGWSAGAFAAGPMLAGMAVTTPLIAGASPKIIYDLALWRACRHVRPPEEHPPYSPAGI